MIEDVTVANLTIEIETVKENQIQSLLKMLRLGRLQLGLRELLKFQ